MKIESMQTDAVPSEPDKNRIFRELSTAVTHFHGYAAPGVLIGCYMVQEAQRRIKEGILYDAICETPWCLPDAVQMLTPCTIGNGWLRIYDLGIYAVSLFDKHTGRGIRVFLDTGKIAQWEDVADWYLKRKPKHEQDSEKIKEQIRDGADRMITVETITVRSDVLLKRSKGSIAICPLCHEAYPEIHGALCRRCQGDSPYENKTVSQRHEVEVPVLKRVAVSRQRF
jgi:formylmethanofuran dehydrogenase subunit E